MNFNIPQDYLTYDRYPFEIFSTHSYFLIELFDPTTSPITRIDQIWEFQAKARVAEGSVQE